MRKNKVSLFIVLVFVLNFSISCVQQGTSKAENLENNSIVKAETEDIRNAQEIIEKSPDAATGYNKLAIAYIRHARETGDFSLNTKADTAVKRALELEGDNVESQKLKASLLLTFHRFPEALEFGKELERQFPKDSFIQGVLTDANAELGNYDAAVEHVQQMVDLRPDMSSYARVSLVRSLHGDNQGAIEAMTNAARIADPKDKEAQAWCLVHLGDEYFKIGKYEAAEKHYDTALKIFPNYHFALAGKGKARAAAGDYENAIGFYTKAQEKIPLTETVIQLGNIYNKTGDADKARKQYELAEVIEKNFGNIDQRRLALLWADQDINLDQALEIAKREHETRKDIFTADILAWAQYKKGNFEEAKTAIKEAMRLETKDAQILYHAGMIEKELGNKKAAADLLRKSVEVSPKFDVLQAEKVESAWQELK